jgi:hypothetical protein
VGKANSSVRAGVKARGEAGDFYSRKRQHMRSPNILPEELTRLARNFCARWNVSLHRKYEA